MHQALFIYIPVTRCPLSNICLWHIQLLEHFIEWKYWGKEKLDTLLKVQQLENVSENEFSPRIPD